MRACVHTCVCACVLVCVRVRGRYRAMTSMSSVIFVGPCINCLLVSAEYLLFFLHRWQSSSMTVASFVAEG